MRSINIEQTGRKHKQSRSGSTLSKLVTIFPPAEALRYPWSGIYRWVAAGYTPGPYPGKLTLFWSTESYSQKADWRKVTGTKNIEDYFFPGSHMSCKNENLYLLAEQLSACLIEVQAA